MMKGQLFLIHWNKVEAEIYAEMLRRTGWHVDVEYEDGARAIKAINKNIPNAVIVYLTRLPSHGRYTAAYLRENTSTRELPIIFVGGNSEVIIQTREKIPDAVFIGEEELNQALYNIGTNKLS